MTHSRNSAASASASTAETTTTSNFSEKDQHIGKMGLTRRSNGSAAAAAAAAGDSSTPSPSPRVLQKWHEIPAHLRFNRYVTSHYRPLDDWKGCLRSLFYIHNETVNIFTHAIPILAILASLRTLLPWSSIDIAYLPTVHVVAFLSPWVGSTLYHLFMNHRRGEGFYKKLLSVDMLGIWVAQNAGSLVPLCATIYCMEQRTQNVVLALYALGSFFSLYKAMTAKCPWQRRYSFLLPFFFRMLVLTARTTGIGRGNELSLWHLFIQDVFAITGAFIGASNIPERWFPGSLDLLFNSHNFMHVLVVVAAYQMHLAVVNDLTWMTAIKEGSLTC